MYEHWRGGHRLSPVAAFAVDEQYLRASARAHIEAETEKNTPFFYLIFWQLRYLLLFHFLSSI